jgi:hypothetical protein
MDNSDSHAVGSGPAMGYLSLNSLTVLRWVGQIGRESWIGGTVWVFPPIHTG